MKKEAKTAMTASKPGRKVDKHDIVKTKRCKLEVTSLIETDCENTRLVRRCRVVRPKKPRKTKVINSENEEKKNKVSFESLESLHLLGVGAFGKVLLCRDNDTSKHYAVKKLKKGPKAAPTRENRVMKSTSHPFLISLVRSFQDRSNLFFVMEFANGGDLFFHLSRRPGRAFLEEDARFYAGEVTLALIYLHDSGIIYRDLKMDNILMDRDGHVKLADFGLSKDGMTRESRTTSFVGTDVYLAPEVIQLEDGGYGFSADWWSLGVVVFGMLLGRAPFFSGDREEIYRLILDEEPDFRGEVRPEAENFIQGLLQKDPSRRLGGPEVRSHEFFAGVDWEMLYCKKVQPPYVPELSSESDVRYFDAEFTKQKPPQLRSFNGSGNIRDEFEGFDWIGKE